MGVPPSALAAVVGALQSDPGASLGTCAVSATSEQHDGRTTLSAHAGRAVAFSRAVLPPGDGIDGILLHLGLYAYRVPDLLRMAVCEATPQEKRESLEQLRWLENGLSVALKVLPGLPEEARAIDWPEDLNSAAARVPD